MSRVSFKVKFVLFVIVLTWVIGAIPATSSAEESVRLQFASRRMGSGWYVMAGVMADVIKGALPPGSTVDALPKSGGVGNPILLEDKKDRPFIRFHAVLSLATGVILIPLSIVTCGCAAIIYVVFFYWAYLAYQGKIIEIPLVSDFARKQGWVSYS